jgi:hypothetical protein
MLAILRSTILFLLSLCISVGLASTLPTTDTSSSDKTASSSTSDSKIVSGLGGDGIAGIAIGSTVVGGLATAGIVKGVQVIKGANLNADVSIAKSELDNATTEYEQAVAALKNANQLNLKVIRSGNLKDGAAVKGGQLDELQSELKIRKAAMDGAQDDYTYISNLKNRPKDVNDAGDDLSDTQDELATAQAKLTKMQATSRGVYTQEELNDAAQNVEDLEEAANIAKENFAGLLDKHGIDADGNPVSTGTEGSSGDEIASFTKATDGSGPSGGGADGETDTLDTLEDAGL